MITDAEIARINELYKKSKSEEGLTEAEEYCGNLMFTDHCDFEPEQKYCLESHYASLFI